MERKNYQNLIVGTVIIVAILLLIGGMAFLNEFRPGQKLNTYYFIADQIGLLSRDDPVKFNGVKQGKVIAIELMDDSRVRITAEIKSGFPVREGSEAQIQNIGLMGERMINISVNPKGRPLPPGTTLHAGYDYGIAETMGAAGKLVQQAQGMLDQVQGVVDSTVGKPQFSRNVNSIVHRVDDVTARLDNLMKDVDPKVRGTMTDLQATGKSARQIVDGAGPKVDRLTGKADKVADETQELVGDLRKISSDLKVISEKTKNGQSTIGKFANDDAFYKDLNTTMHSADSLIQHIRKRGLDVNVDLF